MVAALLWDDITPKSWVRIGSVGKIICEDNRMGPQR